MRSDVPTPNQRVREVNGFKGLYTAPLDTRLIAEGLLEKAQDVVFDQLGNVVPRDGSGQWWAPISQRVQLAEMEISEDAQWGGGATDQINVEAGFQARKGTGTSSMTRTLPEAIDLTLGGNQSVTTAIGNVWIYPTTTGCITALTLVLNSAAGALAVLLSGQAVAAVGGQWTLCSLPYAASIPVGAFDPTAVTSVQLTYTIAGGQAVTFDDAFLSYSDYTSSFCTGGLEFRRISDGTRFVVAGFGDTVYTDLDESKTPAKILSGLTRNAPLSLEVAEDRLAIFDGADAGWVYTGDFVRPIGYPAPTAWTFGFSLTAGSGLDAGQYAYGATFVYGAGATPHGQSTMFETMTPCTVTTGNGIVNITGIPTAAPDARVIARRIWRSRANAGPYATKYFVTELADNTATTYSDTMNDAALVLNSAGPIDNGLPPSGVRQAVWYQKGMVYVTAKSVAYSRPGTNLDETFETVPAENIITLGQAGELVGAVEFNGQLYLFSRMGIGKLQWTGGVLNYQPVQKTSEMRASNIGAAGLRSITVVHDLYIRFFDSTGQVWRLLPNEAIFPDSDAISNIVDDFNRYPAEFSLTYKYWGDMLAWNTGTLGQPGDGANVTTTETPGVLAYSRSTLPQYLFGGTWTPPMPVLNASNTDDGSMWGTKPATGLVAGGDFAPLATGNTSPALAPADWEFLSPSWASGFAPPSSWSLPMSFRLKAERLTQLVDVYMRCTYNMLLLGNLPQTWTMSIYKPHYETSEDTKGALLQQITGTLSGTTTNVNTFVDTELGGALSTPIYIPAGESVIIEVTGITQLYNQGGSTYNPIYFYATTNQSVAGSSLEQHSAVYGPNLGQGSSFPLLPGWPANEPVSGWFTNGYQAANRAAKVYARFFMLRTNAAEVQADTVTSPAFSPVSPVGPALQRWHGITADLGNVNLATGAGFHANVQLLDQTGAVTYGPATSWWDAVTTGLWAPGQATPPTTMTFPFPHPADYRAGTPVTQFTQAVVQFSWDFPVVTTPPTLEALSRIDTVAVNVVPSVVNPYLLYASEDPTKLATTPYNKNNYTFDMWTSQVLLTPGGLTSLGKLCATYVQTQQDIFLQMRVATTSGGISAATWVDVPNNTVPVLGLAISSIGAMQVRVVFQDRPAVFLGTPSYVTSLQIGWSALHNSVPPIAPANIFHFKDYTYMSWAGRGARAMNHSAALSDFQTDYNSKGMWSEFSAPHYTCYFVAGGQLLGGQAAGGRLNLMRQSAVTDADGQPIVAAILTHPMMFGTAAIKTLHWMYLGFVLNVHTFGYNQSRAASWPMSTFPGVSFLVPTPAKFFWGVWGQAQSLWAATFGQPGGGQAYADQITHAADYAVALQDANDGLPAKPLLDEYGFDMGVQERAFQAWCSWSALTDPDGVAYFPTLTNMGFEYFQENYRGV